MYLLPIITSVYEVTQVELGECVILVNRADTFQKQKQIL